MKMVEGHFTLKFTNLRDQWNENALKVYIESYMDGILKMFHDLTMKPNCSNDLPNLVEEFKTFYF
jgi:hypothetical protein